MKSLNIDVIFPWEVGLVLVIMGLIFIIIGVVLVNLLGKN